MRRMIPQKDVDYIDQLKETIHNGPGPEMVTIGDLSENGILLDGLDGWIVSERLGLGDPEGTWNAVNINIDNSDGGGVVISGAPDVNYINIPAVGDLEIYNEIGAINITADGTMNLESYTLNVSNTGGNIVVSGLPTSDPHVAGALWNDNGVLKISSGS